jgi:large subunit ribosomal protein L28
MKFSLQRKKPNIKSKTLHSDILDMDFKTFISMKARKCIMKAGSFDKYLLNTKPADIDSRWGLHIRDLII